MEEAIGKRVIGQAGCGQGRVSRASAAPAPACRTRTGRSARFLFLGPTGVGKTELTKALAEFLFDDPQRDGPHRHVANSWRSTASRG